MLATHPTAFLDRLPSLSDLRKTSCYRLAIISPPPGVQFLYVINAISSRSGTVITGRTSLTHFCVMSISKFFLPFAASMQWPHRIFVHSRSTSAAVCCNRFCAISPPTDYELLPQWYFFVFRV